ncbi:MAG: hypothetical protein JRE58_03680 [Deltaproteobacteria bacterium]|nr:hypothetical protein [Deltaproteobacteria bacterium]
MPFRNKAVIIISLGFVLGAVFILFRPFTSIIETSIRIPVKISDIPQGLILTGPPPGDLELHIRGPKSAIKALSGRFPYYALNLSAVKKGRQDIPLDSKNISLPKTVKIKTVTPPSFVLNIEQKAQKTLPVDLLLSGKPAGGYAITTAEIKPEFVIVSGPVNKLAGMTCIRTKPIDITGISESFKKEIAMDLPDNIAMAVPDKIILVEIHVDHRITTQKISGIPVIGKNSQYAYTITPPKIDLEIRGPVNIIDKFYSKKTPEIYVDLKGLEPGIYVRRATITLPVKIILTKVTPEIFSVTIVRK